MLKENTTHSQAFPDDSQVTSTGEVNVTWDTFTADFIVLHLTPDDGEEKACVAFELMGCPGLSTLHNSALLSSRFKGYQKQYISHMDQDPPNSNNKGRESRHSLASGWRGNGRRGGGDGGGGGLRAGRSAFCLFSA